MILMLKFNLVTKHCMTRGYHIQQISPYSPNDPLTLCKILLVCTHSAHLSAYSFWGPCPAPLQGLLELNVIQNALPQPSCGCWDYWWQQQQKKKKKETSPSLLTGNGNTVKADKGLQQPNSHNKVNNPYQDGSTAHAQQISVWIISWLKKSVQVFTIYLYSIINCFDPTGACQLSQ